MTAMSCTSAFAAGCWLAPGPGRRHRHPRHDRADDRPFRLDRQAGSRPAPSSTSHSTATRSPARRSSSIVKDDTGAADVTKRLAQELVANDHAAALLGFGLTPLALAAAPIATEAKVPRSSSAAATAIITEKSPFIVRTSFTLPQASAPIADWALKNGIKKVVTIVSDYGPGLDAEKSFGDTLQGRRRRDRRGDPRAAEEPRFRAVPAARQGRRSPTRCSCSCRRASARSFMKQFVERGLDKAGIKLIGTGDVTDDDLLADIGDAALGAVTAAPLFGRPRLAREQGVRRRFREGQRRHAPELHGGRRL